MTTNMTIRAAWNSIRVAQNLAERLGHTWGKTELEPRDYSAAEIDAITRRQDNYEPGPVGWGITCPDIEDDWSISHVSGTGRISYEINPEYTRIVWSRPLPFGEVLIAYISPGDADIAPTVACNRRTFGPKGRERDPIYHDRHVDEFLDFVRHAASAVSAAYGVDGLAISAEDEAEIRDGATDEAWWLDCEIHRLQNRLDSLTGVATGRK